MSLLRSAKATPLGTGTAVLDHLLRLATKNQRPIASALPSIQRKLPGLVTALGVDIGSTGAIAVLTSAGELLGIVDMPTLNDGPRGRRAVNPPLLAAIILQDPRLESLRRVRRRASG